MDQRDRIHLAPSAASSLPALPLPPLPYGQAGGFVGLDHVSWSPPKPAVWTVFVVFLIAMVCAAVGSVVAMRAYVVVRYGADAEGAAGFASALADPVGFLAVLMGSQLGFLAVALGAAAFSPMGVVKRLRLGKSTVSLLGYVVLMVGMLAFQVLFSSIVRMLHVPEQGTLQTIQEAFAKMTPGELWLAVLVVGVTPGIAEEFLFRGYVQSRLLVRWWRWAAIVTASLLFGLAHLDPVQSPVTFFMGLFLGYMAERAGSIRPAMVCHAFNNSAAVVLSRLGSGEAGGASGGGAAANHVTFAVAAAAVLALVIVYVQWRVKPPVEPEAKVEEPPLPLLPPSPMAIWEMHER